MPPPLNQRQVAFTQTGCNGKGLCWCASFSWLLWCENDEDDDDKHENYDDDDDDDDENTWHKCFFVQQISHFDHIWILPPSSDGYGYWNTSNKYPTKIPDVHANLTKGRNTPNDSIQNKTRWFSSSVGIRRHLIYLAKFWSRNVSSLWEVFFPSLHYRFFGGKPCTIKVFC